VPVDTRDASGPATAGGVGPEHTLTPKSIAIQKGVSIAIDSGATGTSPGDTLEYTLEVQISDFFAFQSLVATDVFSDGQRWDATFTPTLSVTEHGSTSSGVFDAANVSIIEHFTGGAAVPPVDGTTEVVFAISDELVTRGLDGRVPGGCVPAGGTGSGNPPDCAAFNGGGSIATIVFRTVIQQDFSDDFPSGDRSVDHGDVLGNGVNIIGDLLDVEDVSTVLGTDEDDDSGASVTIELGGLTKSIYAVNGSTTLPSPLEIKPGDTVTYRIQYTLPSSDFEDLAITDYLPLPVFDAGELQTFVDTIDTAAPPAGSVKFGPGETFRALAGAAAGVPGLTTAPAAPSSPPVAPNTVVFSYGDFDDPTDTPTGIDLLFTLTVTAEPFADRLFLTNQARSFEGSTNASDQVADDIVQIVLREPYLQVTKGTCQSDNPDEVFDPAAPLCPDPTAGTFTSDDAAAANIDADVSGIDFGDILTFTVVIENTGGSGAFDIVVRDVLPAGLGLPGGTAAGMNLTIVRGDGFVPTWTGLDTASDADLFASGLAIDDDGGQPLCQPYTPADGTNLLVVTYRLEVTDPALLPGSILANRAGVSSFAGTEGGPNHVDDPVDWSDEAEVTIAAPTMAKALVGTGIVSATNGAAEAVIGELATYRLTVAVPEGGTPDLTITDTLDAGLAFVDCVSISASAGLSTDLAGGFAAACNDPADPLVAAPGQVLTFDLGTVTNPDDDTPANGDDEIITIEYTAVVLNVAGNQAGTTLANGAALSYTGAGGGVTLPTVSAAPITVIEPALTLTKTRNVGTGDANDPVVFTLTVTNPAAASTQAWDLELRDTVPAGLVYEAGTLAVGGTCTAAPTLLDDSAAPLLRATWSGMLPDQSCQVVFTARFAAGLIPNQTITNAAALTWTSLSGPVTDRSPYNTASDERIGTNPVVAPDDYTTTASVGVTVTNVSARKSVVATSEAHTSGNDVAIGEIVRYRLVMQLSETTVQHLQLRDTLPAGLRFLDDGTARAAFVGDGGVTSAAFDGPGANDAPAVTPCANIAGSFTLAQAASTASIPSASIACTLADLNISRLETSEDDAYGSGGTVFFKLGNVTNADDEDPTVPGANNNEFVIIELNALVDNSAAGSNDDGETRVNALRGRRWTGSAMTNLGGNANAPAVTVREPAITDLSKVVSPTTGDAGDALAYTITWTNTGSTTAFEVLLTDALPATLVPSFPAAVTLGGGAAGVTDASAGNLLDITIATVPAGGTVQVDLAATIVDDVPPSTVITNTASLVYTSLPGTGTTGNPTGSDTPGGTGSDTGERDGSDGAGGINDYIDSDPATVTVSSPGLVKAIFATSQPSTGSEAGTDLNDAGIEDLAVGETVTYRLTATLPEGTTPSVAITDTLPVAPGVLSVVSASVVSVGASLYDDGTPPTQPVTFSITTTDNRPVGGDTFGDQVVFDFGAIYNQPDGDTDDADRIVVEVVARVENIAANIDDTDLVNAAQLNFGLGLVNATDVTVEVVEPVLTVDKSASPTSGDAGDTITYTITVQHAASSTAEAFDLELADVIAADTTYVGGSLDCSGGTQAADSCVESSGTITVGWDGLPIGETTVIAFDATLDPSVSPGQTITNTVDLVWDSLPDDGVPHDRDDADDDGADVLITQPGLAKVVADIATDTSVAETGSAVNGPEPDLTIGETVTYTVTITVPEGQTLGAFLSDQLPTTLGTPQGVLEYGSAVVTPGANITIDSDPGTPGDQATVITPSDGPDADALDDLVTFDFGTVTNTPDGVLDADDLIVVSITAKVVDVATNQGGIDDLTNLASYTWTGAAAAVEAQTDVDIVEPFVTLAKTNLVPFGDAGDTITYEVSVTHTGASTADAFDVVLDDTLPVGQSFVQVVAVGGDPLPAVDTSVAGHVIFSYASVPLAAGGYTFRYEVVLTTAVEAGGSYTNRIDGSWDTLPGSGDPDDRATTGVDTADVTINAPALVKVTSSTNLGDTGQAYHDGTLEDLAIGELVTYTLTVTFPEGTISNAVVADQVQADGDGVLEIYDARVLTTGANLSTTQSIISPSPIPAGTTLVSFDFGTVTNSGDNTIDDDDRMVLEVVARVVDDPTNADADTLLNLGTLTYLNGDVSDDASVDVVEPSMTLVKTMSGPVDGVVTMTIELGNAGTAPAYDVVVSDTLAAATWDTTSIAAVSIPTGFTFAATGGPGDATVTIRSDALQSAPQSSVEPGETVSFVVEAALADPQPPSPVTNTATNTEATTMPGTDPGERDEPDVADSDQLDLPSIEVDKAAALAPGGDLDGSGTASPGDILRYTITIDNSGTAAASNVVLTDPVSDPNLGLVSGTVTAGGGGTVTVGNGAGDATVQVNWISLAGPSSTVVTFDVLIANPVPAATSQVVNWANVASDELPDEPSNDPSTPSDDDPTVVPIDAAPDVAVTKTDGVATASPGDTLSYVLTIENLGNTTAPAVSVTDTLPESTSFDSASDGGGETGPGSGVVVWPPFDLAAGAVVTRTVTVTVDNPVPAEVLVLTNTAEARDDGSNGPDSNPDNNSDTDDDDLLQTPLVRVFKTASGAAGGAYAPGQDIVWIITIVNDGGADATGLSITDAVPEFTVFSAGSMTLNGAALSDGDDGDAGRFDDFSNTVRIDIGTVPAGGSVTVTFATTILGQGVLGSAAISNQAFVDTPDGDVPSDDPDTGEVDDPTEVVVVATGIPALGLPGLLLMAILIAAAAALILRRV
jgi:uncharacterized repeat protein (TIGR01451 family)/fimbrial isopeptide formation D2 family protein